MNVISVPMGDQYGTDTDEGDSTGDHSVFGLIRDHAGKSIYWRDETNPTFRRVSFDEVDFSGRKSMKLETGPYYIDMSATLV